jgi:hypothetical protein
VHLPNFVPGHDDAGTLQRGIEHWLFSAPLVDLVQLNGGRLPSGLAVRDALTWFDSFSADHWNFRKGEERWAIRADLSADAVETVFSAVEALGLIGGTVPARPSYDRLLILGGGAPACLIRPHYAATLMAGGTAVGGVAGLGSERPLRDTELDFVRRYESRYAGHSCTDEGDALDLGLRMAFGLTETESSHRVVAVDSRIHADVRRYDKRDDRPRLDVLTVRSADKATRVNTADTYESWSAAEPDGVESVLVVTSEIYVPFQHYDAVRKLGLPLGCAVETVGAPPSCALPDGHRQMFTPASYLQEVRSTIRSMRRLLAALDGDTPLAESR